MKITENEVEVAKRQTVIAAVVIVVAVVVVVVAAACAAAVILLPFCFFSPFAHCYSAVSAHCPAPYQKT